ncbi:IclR family transcriptional regulator [Spirillospora sp. NPDC048911]|uniref:IclR family transcriptional regulator n=1 Tax=Spirillospora sp. NPDC048911 TaxID=3364527 RepID=UPI00372356CE
MSRPDAEGPGGQPADIQAVARAAQILALFGPGTPEITAAGAASAIGLNRTTTYRYCTSLASAGLLERRGEGSFAPGPLALQLGVFALSRREILDLAPPYMSELAAGTHSTAVLSLWGSSGPVVSRVEEDAAGTVSVRVKVGTQLDLSSGQAAVFLAFHRDQLLADRLIATWPSDAQARLRERLEGVQAGGYAAVDNGRGIAILAAPIFDETGLCASMALLNTVQAMSLEPESPQLRLLLSTARQLTAKMGGPSE